MKKPGFFYGYWIVAVCCLFCIVSSGCALAAFSFFVKPLEADMGWGMAQIMAGFTVLLLSMALTSPLAGWLVDRYGARIAISVGALVEGAGLVLLSQMTSLWHYYAGYMTIGIGLAAASQVTTSYVVSQWFKRRRGMAIGIMSTGISIAGIAYAFLVGVYLIPNFGWSTAYLALAASVVVVIIPLALIVIRTRPADMGLLPDGAQAPQVIDIKGTLTGAPEGLSFKAALASPAFWLMAAGYYLLSNHLAVGQCQTPHLSDLGFSINIAASSVSIIASASAIGQFFYGWLCDKIPAKFVAVIGQGSTALGILILITIGADSPEWTIWVYAAIFGFGAGSWLPTMSMLTSTTFGMASYGSIFGLVSFFQSLGAGGGPLIAGALYDAQGSFHWAFIFTFAVVVVAIPVILAIRKPTPRKLLK